MVTQPPPPLAATNSLPSHTHTHMSTKRTRSGTLYGAATPAAPVAATDSVDETSTPTGGPGKPRKVVKTAHSDQTSSSTDTTDHAAAVGGAHAHTPPLPAASEHPVVAAASQGALWSLLPYVCCAVVIEWRFSLLDALLSLRG